MSEETETHYFALQMQKLLGGLSQPAPTLLKELGFTEDEWKIVVAVSQHFMKQKRKTQ